MPFSPLSSKTDFNTVLTTVNGTLFVITLLFYATVELPTLVNGWTLTIYTLLFLQVYLLLKYEKQRRNAFILVLTYVITLFYFPRIITLFWAENYHPSGVLDRLRATTVDDINHTLMFVFVANIAICLGLITADIHVQSRRPSTSTSHSRYAFKLFVLFFLSISYTLYITLVEPLTVGVEKRGLRFLGVLLNPALFLPVAIVYLYLTTASPVTMNRRGLERISMYKLAFISLIILLVVLRAFSGSRASLLSLIHTVVFILLAMGVYYISRKSLVGVAVLIVMSVPLFSIASLSRSIKYEQGRDISLQTQREQLIGGISLASRQGDLVDFLAPVADRTAFLDFSVDVMKNSADYSKVINLSFYGMSIVDNMTPGFDVFNVPRASNALNYIYTDRLVHLTRFDDFYHSDQFNVYGEYYTLFGWAGALPMLFLVAFLIQGIYARVRTKRYLSMVMWRYFLILLFFNWLISFGMDWQIVVSSKYAVILFVLLLILDRKWVIFPTNLRDRRARDVILKTSNE